MADGQETGIINWFAKKVDGLGQWLSRNGNSGGDAAAKAESSVVNSGVAANNEAVPHAANTTTANPSVENAPVEGSKASDFVSKKNSPIIKAVEADTEKLMNNDSNAAYDAYEAEKANTKLAEAKKTADAQRASVREHYDRSIGKSGGTQSTSSEPAKTEAAGEVKKIEEVYAKSSKGELLAEHKITNKDGVDLGAKHNELNSEIKTTKEAIEKAAEGDAKKGLATTLETLEKDHKAVSEELIKGKEAIYKEKVGIIDGMKARFAGTFGEVNKSTSSKVVRGTGLAVGLGAIVDGTRRIIAPERDENGERKGSAWAAVGEIGAGAGAIALALKGGHHRAMGIA